jgi:hypothetical protein
MFGTVGRATVPAETGRHGGRPYDSTRPKFLFRFDWTLAASGGTRMKLRESNVIFVKFHTRLQSKDFVLVPRIP